MKIFGFRLGRAEYIGIALMLFGIILAIIVTYINSITRMVPIIFSQKEILANTWINYKNEFLEPETYRTLDKQQDNITTSEGQSYTMLRAVWIDDKDTFDKSFKWTQENLKHKNNNLHAWLFGKSANGSYKVLTEKGGENSASDAESDMAVSLVFAYVRWGDKYYLDEANKIINDLWDNNVVAVKKNLIFTANDLEQYSNSKILVNPSYLSPYAYRIFAVVDKKHNWQRVVDSSYEILRNSSSSTLDKKTSANITPDWIEINRNTGEISAPSSKNLSTNYGYDALRTPWRIALDWQWYKDPQAKALLDSYSFFGDKWEAENKIITTYTHDGISTNSSEAPAMYGGIIGYFMTSDKKNSELVYSTKLKILYNPDTNSWRTKLGYYDDNWAWFGIGLYENLLPNLAELLENK